MCPTRKSRGGNKTKCSTDICKTSGNRCSSKLCVQQLGITIFVKTPNATDWMGMADCFGGKKSQRMDTWQMLRGSQTLIWFSDRQIVLPHYQFEIDHLVNLVSSLKLHKPHLKLIYLFPVPNLQDAHHKDPQASLQKDVEISSAIIKP